MHSAEEDAARRSHELKVLFILFVVQFTSIVDFMVIMPLGIELMSTLDIGAARFGIIVSSYTFSAAIAGVLASALIDRFGRKQAFLTLYAGFLVGTLLCGVAPTFLTLLAARIVTGAFGGVLGGLSMAIIGDVFPYERRGQATGILMGAFSLASSVGVPFGLFLGTRYGWHSPFLMIVAFALPVMILGIFILPTLRDHLNKGPGSGAMSTLIATYTHPNHLRAFALMGSIMFGSFLVVPFITPYLVGNCGIDKDQLPWLFVAGGVMSFITNPLIGKWADRAGKLHVYRIVVPVSAIVMVILSNLPVVPLWVAMIAVASLMMSNAGRMAPAMAMITAAVEPRFRGGFMSANSSIQHVASGLGSLLAGLIIVRAADGRLENYSLVGLIGAGSTLVSLWLAGRLRISSKSTAPPFGAEAEPLESITAAEAL